MAYLDPRKLIESMEELVRLIPVDMIKDSELQVYSVTNINNFLLSNETTREEYLDVIHRMNTQMTDVFDVMLQAIDRYKDTPEFIAPMILKIMKDSSLKSEETLAEWKRTFEIL